MKVPNRFKFPKEFNDAAMLEATGWDPEVLDRQSVERVQKLIVYKNVKSVAENGGEYDP